jgi:hypothetical protein
MFRGWLGVLRNCWEDGLRSTLRNFSLVKCGSQKKMFCHHPKNSGIRGFFMLNSFKLRTSFKISSSKLNYSKTKGVVDQIKTFAMAVEQNRM